MVCCILEVTTPISDTIGQACNDKKGGGSRLVTRFRISTFTMFLVQQHRGESVTIRIRLP